ncbi:MAG: hypothetical protein LCH53_11435 [Bacteroidetes bacterium]|nr:hypothetical protein [Bacteroidota bacterium]
MLRSFLAAAALLAPASAFAQAGAFVRMGFDARSLGLGRATAADLSGLASTFDNPALAPFSERQHADLTAGLLSQDRQFQSIEIGSRLPPRAGVAGGIVRAAVTGIDGRDASGQPTGEIQTQELGIFVAFGIRPTQRLSAGVGLQIFNADFGETLRPAIGLGLDVGATFRVNNRIALGFVADDLLAGYAWSAAPGSGASSAKDRFPTRLRLGGSYTQGPIRVVAEAEGSFTSREGRTTIDQLEGTQPREATVSTGYTLAGVGLRGGAEYRLNPALWLRAGVDGLAESGTGIRPSAGATFEQEAGPVRLRGHYAAALEPYGNGLRHLLTVRVLF